MAAKKKKEEQIVFSKYERARIIGARALQISMGAPFLVKLSKNDLEKLKYNPLEIAKKEYGDGALPLTVNRPMPTDKPVKKE